MSEVKTTIRGPFIQKPKRTNKPSTMIDPNSLVICDDKFPEARANSTEYKYDAKFAKMKPGQALECKPADIGRVSGALRNYIERHKMRDHVVRSTKDYEQTGTGRVWLMYVGRQLREAA